MAGCGKGGGPERLPIHGTVTLPDGDQLHGSITFLPAGKGSGVAATAKVEGGSYKFDRKNGPTAGPKTVIVRRVVTRNELLQTRSKTKTATSAKSEWTRPRELLDDGQYLYDFELD